MNSSSTIQPQGKSRRGRWRDVRQQTGVFWLAFRKDLRQGRTKGEPATGLRVRRKFLEWATLCEGKKGMQTLSAGRAPAVGDETAWADAAKLAAEMRSRGPALRGPIAWGLSPEHMLLRVVDLPSTDPREMDGMIKLQLDKFSPFPEERVAFSYECLQATEGGFRVLIVAVPKEEVDFAGAVCRQAGLDLRRIDADVLGWWRVLADQGAVPAEGRRLLLLLDEEAGILFAVQQGAPVAVKTVASRGELSEEEYAAEIAHEMGAFILSLDMEQGVAPVAGLEVWHRGAPPAPLLAKLKTELGQDTCARDLDSLPSPSEGLARRLLQPSGGPASAVGRDRPATLNLVPAEWRADEDAQRVQRRLVAASVLALGLWLALGLGFTGGYLWQQRSLAKIELRRAELQKPADAVRAMQRSARSFEQYLDRKYSALECLREVTRLLPEGVTLTAFQFKKAKNIILRGEARTVEPIYDFKQALDKSKLFKQIEMGSTQPGKRKEETIQTFQLIVHLPEGQAS